MGSFGSFGNLESLGSFGNLGSLGGLEIGRLGSLESFRVLGCRGRCIGLRFPFRVLFGLLYTLLQRQLLPEFTS